MKTTHPGNKAVLILSAIILSCTSPSFQSPTGPEVQSDLETAQGVVDSQSTGHGRVTVCHLAGRSGRILQIRIAQAALPAHMAHGDSLPRLFFPDADRDGYGAKTVGILACTAGPGQVANNGDCADDDPAVNPGALEVCDNVDNNCDGEVDEDGVCGPSTHECAGSTCFDFKTCNPNSCGGRGVCGSTAAGGGGCVDGAIVCSALPSCINGDSDCAAGSTCFVDSCCMRPVCVSTAQRCNQPSGVPTLSTRFGLIADSDSDTETTVRRPKRPSRTPKTAPDKVKSSPERNSITFGGR